MKKKKISSAARHVKMEFIHVYSVDDEVIPDFRNHKTSNNNNEWNREARQRAKKKGIKQQQIYLNCFEDRESFGEK